jgi:hypothetical protein
MKLVAGLSLLLAISAGTAFAQTPPAKPDPAYKAPRTSFGAPSLEGTWTHNFIIILEAQGAAPLVVPEAAAKGVAQQVAASVGQGFDQQLDPEVPALMATVDGLPLVRGERRSRSVVMPADGKLPLTPEGKKQQRGSPSRYEDPEQRPYWERCITGLGLPPVTGVYVASANPRQLVQTQGHVVIYTEYGLEARIIPFADKHQTAALKPLLGDSIARWDGETLVIETIGLPAGDSTRVFSNLVVPATSKVTERYTRVSDAELNYQYTVEDPSVYTAPWLAEYSIYRTDQKIYEHGCHEGNYSLPNILKGARVADERKAREPVAKR